MSVTFYGITKEQWAELCGFFDGKCPRCGGDDKMSVDHIIPVSKGGKHYDIRNLQPLCFMCNRRKRFDTTDYRPRHVQDWAELAYLNQGDIRDAPSPPRPKSVLLSVEDVGRIELLTQLHSIFPKGITSVLKTGLDMVWARYGSYAEELETRLNKLREGHAQ